MLKLKPGPLVLTDEATIPAAARADPDAVPDTEDEGAAAKRTMRRGRSLATVSTKPH